MHAVARFDPLPTGAGPKRIAWTPGMSLAAIARAAEAPDWFFAHGVIRIEGREIYRDLWPVVKPKEGAFVDLCVTVHGGKTGKLVLTLATVALAVASAFVAPYLTPAIAGLGFSAGAAGAISAGLIAAANIGAQMALRSLIAPPTRPAIANAQREISQSGISANQLTPGEPLPGIVGMIRASPPILIPWFTELVGDKLYTNAMVGCMGRNLVEDVLINGIDIAAIPGVTYETREGNAGEADTFLSTLTVIQSSTPVVLSNYELKGELDFYDQLSDQTTPTNSYSEFHRFKKKEGAYEARVMLLFDGGIVKAGASATVPIRVRVRKLGDVTWRNLPTFHIRDTKAAGPFRRELKFIWGTPGEGRWPARNDAFDCHVVSYRTAVGQSFEYLADPYFESVARTDQLPVMTAATTSGVTVSASSELSATEAAWKAADGTTGGTPWQPANNSLPAWWKVDWGVGNTKNFRSYVLGFANNFEAADWTFEGSNDDTAWTVLHTVTANELANAAMQCAAYGAYRYHRFTFTANTGAANQQLKLENVELFIVDNSASTGSTGAAVTDDAARYVKITQEGCTVYLDSTEWPEDEYEIEIQRGWAFASASMDYGSTTATNQYILAGFTNITDFFGHFVNSGKATIYQSQHTVQSKTTIEAFTQVRNERPIRAETEARLTRIAVRVPDLSIREGISAMMTGYARTWNGTVWIDTPVPARNPAAFYRDALLLLDKNAEPLPGEIIDEASLETWFTHCEAEGFTCDAVVHDRSMADVLQLLASCGRASPRNSNYWGVVIDRDRSADDPTILLTPETSRDLGTTITYENIPHGFRVAYLDEDDEYRQKNVMVYRAGFNGDNATDVKEMSYTGITSLAKATAQAIYDLGQLSRRNIEYRREVFMEGFDYARGEKVAIADEVIMRHSYWGFIKSVTTSAGDVTGFTLYGTAKLSESADQGFDTFGCTVRGKEGGILLNSAAITQTTDTATVTLATPVADTGQFVTDQPIAIGPLGSETTYGVLRHKEYAGNDTWRLSIVPEANEIFA